MVGKPYFVLGKFLAMIKYSVSLMLWKNDPNPKGLFPVYIRVTISRDRKYIATGIFIQEKHWDPKVEQVKEGNPMHELYNADLTTRKQAAIRAIVDKQVKGEMITAGQVKEQFSARHNLHNIFDFIDDYKKNLLHKRKPGTLSNYEKYSRKLLLFHGSRNLAFEDINTDYLQRYEDSLRAELLDGNYIFANFKMLRTFFNAARKKKIIACYPFSEYENPTYSQKDKDYLNLYELDRWERYADITYNPTLKQAAIYFLLGCYTGLRVSDWQLFDPKKNIRAGSIRLRAKKNGEWVTMPITARLYRTLERVGKTPLTISEPEINRSLKDIAKADAVKINKHLTSHGGRHTFAVTMCADQGIGVEVCAELMGITVATCAKTYYKVTKNKIAQECMEAWKDLK